MKTTTTLPAALLAHYATGRTTLAHALRITRTDGRVYGFTSHDTSVPLSGTYYDAGQGLDISSIATAAGLAVDNLDLTTLDDGTLFTHADVLAGVWQNAAFVILRYNWATPANGVEYLLAGTVGQVRLMRGSIVCELRGLQQYLQQPIGNVTSKTCRARFADFPTAAGNNLCRLSAAAWTDALTVTVVADRRTFTATKAGPRGVDWYNNGVLTWSTGANAGLRAHVKTYSAGQQFVLVSSLPYAVQVGDTLSVVAGCRKRLAEDCRDRFNNVINFQGEPHMPGIDKLMQSPTPSA